MLPYRDSRLVKIALVVFFLIVLGYAYYEAQGILFGPTITVASAVQTVHEPLVSIQGQASHISSLSMNGTPISVTENGTFDEPYALAPGYNRVVLDAKDKYGRSRQEAIEIIYIPNATSSMRVASSTTSEASSTPAVAQ